MEKWLRTKPEIERGFSASEIRKVTVTLGDPEIYHVKSDLASFLGHSEGLATYSNIIFFHKLHLSGVVEHTQTAFEKKNHLTAGA